ncbi:hypothetical protein QM787_25450 [Rhodococcus ruber]|uniref:membrane protein n=1 Tax=Rhodococcus TaxID=1827 RepID=UPI00058ADE19|nr:MULTISPECIES: membrane protein [Rhodococcus]AXY49709.1 hypothetical protein YT1_0252 [Rhodococcus ruber]MBD8057054.1 hypothetical protein [Rhodococcus ruber]MCD2129876.1 hypothetical protein [Rhodococcus ruber]MCF8784642.1 hypothetical protein [Rhodococcus ruber]MCZ1075649.1 hypothetical protein [Rhodococcus sp. A5(2022)]
MTNEERRDPQPGLHDHPEGHGGPQNSGGHGRHRWMMIACCIPMLVIALVLVLTGTVGAGAVVFALACLGMMAMMMLPGGGHRH